MLCKLPLFSFDYLCKSPKLGFTLTSTAKVGIYFNISKKTLILARSVCCWVSRWSKINLCSLLLFSPQVWPIYNLYYTASDQRYHCWRQSSNIQTKKKFQRCHFSCVFHRNQCKCFVVDKKPFHCVNVQICRLWWSCWSNQMLFSTQIPFSTDISNTWLEIWSVCESRNMNNDIKVTNNLKQESVGDTWH